MPTNKQVLDVFEGFVQKLEVYLGVKRTPVDFSKLWLEKSPHDSTETFDEYFLKASGLSLCAFLRVANHSSRHTSTFSITIRGTIIASSSPTITRNLVAIRIFPPTSPTDGTIYINLRNFRWSRG